MPLTKVENEHEQLVSMFKQLVDEREMLSRENEYLKAKLNESILMETIKEMKKERDLLLKLLSNLTMNNSNNQNIKDEQLGLLKQRNLPGRPTSSSTMNRPHRFKAYIERQPPMACATENGAISSSNFYPKLPPANKKILVYPTPLPHNTNKIIRKHDIQLKHSPNSPFQHYRSQSLQDLT